MLKFGRHAYISNWFTYIIHILSNWLQSNNDYIFFLNLNAKINFLIFNFVFNKSYNFKKVQYQFSGSQIVLRWFITTHDQLACSKIKTWR